MYPGGWAVNELIYHAGGTLYLDEPFEAQPSAATISLTTLGNQALTTLDATFTALSAVTATLDNLSMVLPATNRSARLISPTSTTGTVPDLTSEGYRLLINRGGRKYWVRVSEYDGAVTSFRVDEGLDFDLKAGDTAKGVRVSYAVGWTAVTSTFTGQIKAHWAVTVGGVVQNIVKIYDVVRQVLKQPATWSDVLARRPDADNQMSEVRDKEKLVRTAWEDVVQYLYNRGIRHNLIISDGATTLRDAVVLQTLYNSTLHQSLPVPLAYSGQGETYISELRNERNNALSQLMMPSDSDENFEITRVEKETRKAGVYMRSPPYWRSSSADGTDFSD